MLLFFRRKQTMAYDAQLTMRFREALPSDRAFTEKKMMGAACFMLDGNMIGGADRTKSGEGRFLFRIGKDNSAKAEALPGAEAMKMGRKRMSGFYCIDEAIADKKTLAQWMRLALDLVSSLPAK